METIQIIVNVLVPVALAWAGWLTKHVTEVASATDKCQAQVTSVFISTQKEMDRLNSEMIANRNGYSELAAALARLSAQTEMVLVLLEQLKAEVRRP